MSDLNSIGAAREESLLHAQDYLQMLRTRWKEALLVFFIVFVSSAVITRMMTPKYTSFMQFEIKMPREIVTPAMGAQSPITLAASGAYMETQFELLISERNLIAIANKLELPAEWACSDKIAAERLIKMVEVEPRSGTDLIDVTVTSPDPRLSQRVCRAVADCYAEVREQKENDLINQAINSRFEVLRSRQDELERKADVVREYIRSGQYLSSGVWGGGTLRDSEMVEQTVNDANSRKNALQNEISTMEVHIGELQKLQDEEMLSYVTRTGLLTAESYSSNKVRTMSEKLKEEMDEREKMLMSHYGVKHPHVKLLDNQIESTRSRLYAELLSMREAMLSQLNVKKAELEVVKSELAAAKDILKVKMLEDQKIGAAVEEYKAEKSRYDQLENEYIADKIRMLTPREIIDVSSEPSAALVPSSPNHQLNLILGAAVGLIAGVGVAFIYNYFDTSIKSLEDAERKLNLPVLGVIPKDAALMILQEGDSPDAEAYRILRTNIELRRALYNSNIYTVTSANAGDGKTTTVANLAFVFAQSGYRTLMIDGDMRRPRLARYNDMTSERGLSNYLSEDLELRDVVIKSEEPNLYLLPSGPQPSDPSALLGSYRMDQLLKEASKRFDIVFIDASPILGVSDAAILVNKTDATLFILQPRKMPSKVIQRAMLNIREAGGKIMGLVMNNVDISGDSTYQYYTTYYSYYSSDSKRKDKLPKVTRKRASNSQASSDKSTSPVAQAASEEEELY
ncbi:MAG: polysaccharide biosynthesis tyrosine autokinase [Akkermansia sp.]